MRLYADGRLGRPGHTTPRIQTRWPTELQTMATYDVVPLADPTAPGGISYPGRSIGVRTTHTHMRGGATAVPDVASRRVALPGSSDACSSVGNRARLSGCTRGDSDSLLWAVSRQLGRVLLHTRGRQSMRCSLDDASYAERKRQGGGRAIRTRKGELGRARFALATVWEDLEGTNFGGRE